MFDSLNLNYALLGLGAKPSDDLFQSLRKAYTEPGRFYHTDVHVAECLRHAKRYGHLAMSLPEIEISIWFHDAVYDTRRNDNEELSAEWAKRELMALGAPLEAISTVAEMILATKTHKSVFPDTNLLLDIDLGVLGASPPIFENYDQGIRNEYSWVPIADYRMGRSKVLASFLERPAIFKTLELKNEYETQARENLHRKLADLSA